MLDAVADYARLLAAGARLSRYDALAPQEIEHHLPTQARWIAAAARIGARTTAADGTPLRPGERLAVAFEKMSPAYVKLGQFMATRPDLIGFDMAKDLGRLQDRMPPFPTDAAVAAVEKASGMKLEELFADFSEPVAAASVAQVHRATLKDGRKVAVKVLRPGIESEVDLEFRAFGRAARRIERWAENDPLVCRNVVTPVIAGHGRGDVAVIEHPNLRADERCVITVRESENAQQYDHQHQSTHTRLLLLTTDRVFKNKYDPLQ